MASTSAPMKAAVEPDGADDTADQSISGTTRTT
jgi:hypothetical protein